MAWIISFTHNGTQYQPKSLGEENYLIAKIIVEQYKAENGLTDSALNLWDIESYIRSKNTAGGLLTAFFEIHGPSLSSNNVFMSPTIVIGSDEYYVQQGTSEVLGNMEIIARDSFGCSFDRRTSVDHRAKNYAYTTLKISQIKDAVNGIGTTPSPVGRRCIGKNVTESEPVIESFSAALRRIRPDDYDEDRFPEEELFPINVQYDERVRDDEKIPGLRYYIFKEMEEINKAFQEKLGFNGLILDRLKVILSPEKVQRTYRNPIDPELIDALVQKYRGFGINAVPSKDLEKIVSDNAFTDTIGGVYLCDNPDGRQTIIIYYRVLNTDSSEDYFADVRLILSHEMLHALHHRHAPATFRAPGAATTRVKEALADFFCFAYCLDDNTCIWGPDITACSKKASERCYKGWKKRFNTIWPYAYALYFMIINGEMTFSWNIDDYEGYGCKDKWREVFDISRRNMADAYDCLRG